LYLIKEKNDILIYFLIYKYNLIIYNTFFLLILIIIIFSLFFFIVFIKILFILI
jgi:hypothetical protein